MPITGAERPNFAPKQKSFRAKKKEKFRAKKNTGVHSSQSVLESSEYIGSPKGSSHSLDVNSRIASRRASISAKVGGGS